MFPSPLFLFFLLFYFVVAVVVFFFQSWFVSFQVLVNADNAKRKEASTSRESRDKNCRETSTFFLLFIS